MGWLAYALCAAVFWGFCYTLVEQMMKKVSVPGAMLPGVIGTLLLALPWGLWTGALAQDWRTLKADMGAVKIFAALTLVFISANFCILMSIRGRNATMAAMIEISYPLFTALCAWLLFKEAQIGPGTLLGGALIMAGVAVVYFWGKPF